MKFKEGKGWVYLWGKIILDILFPIFCLGCQTEGEWVCLSCQTQIFVLGVFACPVCHEGAPGGYACLNCRKKSALARQVSLFLYKESALPTKSVVRFKYDSIKDLERLFNLWLAEFVTHHAEMFRGYTMIVPVPLHPRRFCERGFNQALSLAQGLEAVVGIPVREMLVRQRYTRQQAKLNKNKRAKNVRGAFKTIGNVRGARIILVDDVYTTGATMLECAAVLKKSGASVVFGLTLLRG